jgi:hypothetical protein
MLNTVKNVMHRMDGAGDLARNLGGSSLKLAKSAGHVAKDLGGSSLDLAKTVGVGSIAIAKKIGVKRGLAGFAILGAATIGGIFLVRYLRERRAVEESIEASDAETPEPAQPVRRRRQSRAKRKANHAQH